MSENPSTDDKKSKSAQEWGDVFRQMETQVRREAARLLGVPEDSDWSTIGHQTDDAARRNVAKAVGLTEESDWDTIGRTIETRGRRGVGRVVGTSEDAEWSDIGRSVEERVKVFLDDIFGKKSRQAPAAQPKPTDTTADDTANKIVDPWE